MTESRIAMTKMKGKLGGRAAAQLLQLASTAVCPQDQRGFRGAKPASFMRFLAIVVLFLCALSARAALAGEIKPYNPAEFDKLAAEGKPILLDIRADWCSTCAAQAPVIRDLMAQSKYKDLTMFTINFDTDTALLLAYHVQVQSTLIVLKGKKEEGRSVGDTSRQGIERLLNSAVARD